MQQTPSTHKVDAHSLREVQLACGMRVAVSVGLAEDVAVAVGVLAAVFCSKKLTSVREPRHIIALVIFDALYRCDACAVALVPSSVGERVTTKRTRADICAASDGEAWERFRAVLLELNAQVEETDWVLGVDLYRVRVGDQVLHIFTDAWYVDIEGPDDLVRNVVRLFESRI